MTQVRRFWDQSYGGFMSARHKLNQANLNGVLLIAGVAAFLFGAWEVFLLLAVLLTIGAIIGGGIRLSGRRR